MKVAYLSPLPPARTGIAHYSAILLPALRRKLEATPFASPDGYRREEFDLAIYQLGNNPHHEWIYREAMARPGIVVLHDLVLHHLIVEMTLARGDVEGFVAALEENHGPAGAAWARGRAAGMHGEIGNFLLPASIALAQRSLAVIVHNRWAAERLQSFGVTTPVIVVPHPYVPSQAEQQEQRDAIRTRHGFGSTDRVIGFFGFLTSAKRAATVLAAFDAARAKDRRLKLLVVGDPAPDIAPASLAGEGIVVTGYAPDAEFDAYYAAADRLVNLRYPSAGETSGTLIRAFDAGKPVAVSDYAQFAEYPESCVEKIPLGEGEVQALTSFFVRDLDEEKIARAQREWLEANATLQATVDGYAAAAGQARVTACNHRSRPAAASRAITPSIPLFPQLKLVGLFAGAGVITMTVRNGGEAPVRTRTYGQPEYRVIAKLFDGAEEKQDRWLSLPADVPSGETVVLQFATAVPSGRYTLRLYDGVQSIPAVDVSPWATAELVL